MSAPMESSAQGVDPMMAGTTAQPAEPSSKPPPSAANPEAKNTNANAASASSPNIEFEPPAACIRRLLKAALPKSTNVSKDSLAAISRASGIFVLYLTACANDVAREGRRTTIVAKDVLGALKELDFEEFVPLMEKFLEGHRKEERSKKEEKERLKKQHAQQQDKLYKDGTTGRFVAKDDKKSDGNEDDALCGNQKESTIGSPEGMLTTAEAKQPRVDEAVGSNGNEGEKTGQPLTKKQKVDNKD